MSGPIALIRHGLIVSVQATALDDPMCDSDLMARVARAAVRAGAVAIRCGGVGGAEHVSAIRAAVDVPVIGLTKGGAASGVRITPTVTDVHRVIEAGADLVAIDATPRPRPDGSNVSQVIKAIHAAGRLVVADIATIGQARDAASHGADLVATTLAGYIGRPAVPREPDLELVGALARELRIPVIAEGRFFIPALARQALAEGAHAVVVGSAITSPAYITRQFIDALSDGHGQQKEKPDGTS